MGIDIAGKVIASVAWGEDSIRIAFVDGAVLVGDPEGDCCSHSWIETVESGASGGVVVAVKEVIELDRDVINENAIVITIITPN